MMVAPGWLELVLGAFALQLLAGIGLAVAGLVMTAAQRRMGPPEGRWPLSRVLTAIGGVLIFSAMLEAVGAVAVLLFVVA